MPTTLVLETGSHLSTNGSILLYLENKSPSRAIRFERDFRRRAKNKSNILAHREERHVTGESCLDAIRLPPRLAAALITGLIFEGARAGKLSLASGITGYPTPPRLHSRNEWAERRRSRFQ